MNSWFVRLCELSLVSSLALSGIAVAQTDVPATAESQRPAIQVLRFNSWLDAIDKDILNVEPNEVPDRLYKNKTREKVFSVQALGRIYKKQDPAFRLMHDRFKDLEDAIGDYQKWADYAEQGLKEGVSEAVQAKLDKNRAAGRQHLVDALKRSKFLPSSEGELPYTVSLRNFISSYKWMDEASDRKFVVEKLIAELESAKTAQYDFSHLEDGNGVHEFRRKMRWFSMEARGLNGLITLLPKDTACPVAEWEYLERDAIAKTKYAVLPASAHELNPIQLTPCLYIKVARMVEDVNQIKAKFEAQETFSTEESKDFVAEEDQAKVQEMLDEVLRNDLFGKLQDELRNGLEK